MGGLENPGFQVDKQNHISLEWQKFAEVHNMIRYRIDYPYHEAGTGWLVDVFGNAGEFRQALCFDDRDDAMAWYDDAMARTDSTEYHGEGHHYA